MTSIDVEQPDLEQVVAGIEPVIPVVERDLTLEARLGYVEGYLSGELAAVMRPSEAVGQRILQDEYVSWSPLVAREGKQTILTDSGMERAQEIASALDVSSIKTQDDYLALKGHLRTIQDDLRVSLAEETDRTVVRAKMATVRTVLSQVRMEGSNALNRDKIERQIAARELLSMAVAQLGLANLSFDSISKDFLKGYYEQNKTEENRLLVATARAMAQASFKKGEQLVPETMGQTAVEEPEAPIRVLRIEPRPQMNLTRGEKIALGGATAALAAAAAVAGIVINQGRSIAHAAGRVESLPTVTAYEQPSRVGEATHEKTAPTEIVTSGPVEYTISMIKDGTVARVKVGVEGKKPVYKYFTAETAQQFVEAISHLGDNEIVAITMDGVTGEYGHSAWSLRDLVFRPIVNTYLSLFDNKTGKMSKDPVVSWKKDEAGNTEVSKVIAWVKVPASITSTRAYIAYLRAQLPKGTEFDGFKSTCMIPQGQIVGTPKFYLAAVTQRITAEEGEELMRVPSEDRSIQERRFQTGNPNKSKNRTGNVIQDRQQRLRFSMGRGK